MPQRNPELAPLYNLFGLSSNFPLSSLIEAVEDCKRRAERTHVDAWVKCADQLPELDTPVWVNLPDGQIIVAERGSSTDGWMWAACYGHYFSDGKWQAADSMVDEDYEPTHWQPMPTPPSVVSDLVQP